MHAMHGMTPRRAVETALRGGRGPVVPFTIYESLFTQCAAERELRDRGMCILKWDSQPVVTRRPNVKVRQEVWREAGKRMVRTFYETPVGTVNTLEEDAGFTSWMHEKMFKGPGDYKVLRFLFEDVRYEANYGAFAKAERDFGEDGIYRAGMGTEPLQTLITEEYMDMNDFCAEWMENRDEVLAVYGAITECRRRVYRLVAESPALHAGYGGNFVPEIVGPADFEKYYMPHYAEAAEEMHKNGKLLGCHYDANCRSLSHLIAKTGLDFIEAFTPAPDTDMTLAEARKAWPDKVLWLNFPSSVHIKPDAEVERKAVALLGELESVDGVIMGITEDMPPDRWRDSCRAIMDGLDRHARENPGKYANSAQ